MEKYWYSGTVIRVVDGDTVEIELQLGFKITRTDKFRILGIDSPETTYRRKGLSDEEWEAEKIAGAKAKEFASELLPEGTEVMVRTHKDGQGKYGRYLAEIFIGDANFATEMLKAGHAEEYKK